MADVANRPSRCGDTRLVHLLTFLLTVDAQTGGQVDCSALNGRTNHAFLPPPSRLFTFLLSLFVPPFLPHCALEQLHLTTQYDSYFIAKKVEKNFLAGRNNFSYVLK